MQAATSFCGVWPQLFLGHGRVYLLRCMSKGSMHTGMCAAQPLEQGLCKAVYYFFLEEYDMP